MKLLVFAVLGGLCVVVTAHLAWADEIVSTNVPIMTADSPDKIWRFQQIYSTGENLDGLAVDNGDPVVQLQIIHPDESFSERHTFLTVGKLDHPLLEDSMLILAKWEDNSNLLLAVPDDMSLQQGTHNNLLDKLQDAISDHRVPEEFRGIHIHLASYPADTDKFRNKFSKSILEKNLAPSFSFKKTGDRDHAECSLEINGPENEYIGKFYFGLSTEKHPDVTANRGGKLVLIKGGLGNGFSISRVQEKYKDLGYVTSAEVDGFPASDKAVLYARSRENYKIPDLVGPAVSFSYTLNDPKDYLLIADKIKRGELKIKMGYWLDNTEVVYSINKPDNTASIDQFEKCINDNHLF